jgi:hypothetical protein
MAQSHPLALLAAAAAVCASQRHRRERAERPVRPLPPVVLGVPNVAPLPHPSTRAKRPSIRRVRVVPSPAVVETRPSWADCNPRIHDDGDRPVIPANATRSETPGFPRASDLSRSTQRGRCRTPSESR